MNFPILLTGNYTIPRNKWELQRENEAPVQVDDYTIPRNKWELQHYDKKGER